MIGKGGDELDLLLAERPDSAAHKRDDADRGPVAQERNAKHRVQVVEFLRLGPGIFRIGFGVEYMNDLAINERPSRASPARQFDRLTPHQFREFPGKSSLA